MMLRKNRHSGFTLVEIIASMLIVGIMVAVAGFGMVTFMQGYATTRENAAIAQKATLAIDRITRELESLTAMDTTSGSACIRYRNSILSEKLRRIQYKGGKIEIVATSTAGCSTEEAGQTLTDGVKDGSFKITYLKYSQDPDVEWDPTTDDLMDLAALKIEFSMVRNDGSAAKPFEVTINPRNTGAIKAPGVGF